MMAFSRPWEGSNTITVRVLGVKGWRMTEDVAGVGPYDSAPSALVFADSPDGGDAAAKAVAAIGGRVAARLRIEDAVDRLDRQAGIDAILVELSRDHGPLSDSLLDLLSYIAVRDDRPVIVTAPFSLLDCVAARLRAGPVTLLCEPDMIDRVSALALAICRQSPLGVADISAEADNNRLRRLSEEVGRIAHALARLSDDQPTQRPEPVQPAIRLEEVQLGFSAESIAMPTAEQIRAILRCRRMRNRFFDPALFADPAWDMLLDLLAARIEGAEVAVTSLCIAADVPSTTALRWIKNLTDLGIFHRRADPFDGRRIFISLTDGSAQAMAAYFATVARMSPLVV